MYFEAKVEFLWENTKRFTSDFCFISLKNRSAAIKFLGYVFYPNPAAQVYINFSSIFKKSNIDELEVSYKRTKLNFHD